MEARRCMHQPNIDDPVSKSCACITPSHPHIQQTRNHASSMSTAWLRCQLERASRNPCGPVWVVAVRLVLSIVPLLSVLSVLSLLSVFSVLSVVLGQHPWTALAHHPMLRCRPLSLRCRWMPLRRHLCRKLVRNHVWQSGRDEHALCCHPLCCSPAALCCHPLWPSNGWHAPPARPQTYNYEQPAVLNKCSPIEKDATHKTRHVTTERANIKRGCAP